MDKVEYIFEHPEDDDTTFAVAFRIQMMHIFIATTLAVYRAGSLPGKAPNLERNYDTKHTYYMHNYFWTPDCLRPGKSANGP